MFWSPSGLSVIQLRIDFTEEYGWFTCPEIPDPTTKAGSMGAYGSTSVPDTRTPLRLAKIEREIQFI
jgi:hypothetical protein